MSAQLIDGKKISAMINEENAQEVSALARNYNLQPGLAVVLVGEDPASKVYVNMKIKKCGELGILSKKCALPADATMEDVLAIIDELNNDPKIHGILVQSPPPPQIDEEKIIAAIDHRKDVDCFHAVNVGKMLSGDMTGFLPCTPYGVMQLLKRSNVEVSGKHAVIVGRSNIVGKPMMAMLVQKADGANATVTVCHSRTPNIKDFTLQADILIAAIGKPEFITGDMVKEGAVVIDVGINRVDADTERGYKLVGDVNFAECVQKAAMITPVPGGVGPMTIAMLMDNTIKACKLQNNLF